METVWVSALISVSLDLFNQVAVEESKQTFRPCLVGRKFYVFSIQTFRKQGKYV